MENRKHITTNELSTSLGVQGNTVRRGYCVNGHYMGIKPIKLPNNRLLWPKAELNRLLSENSNCCPCND